MQPERAQRVLILMPPLMTALCSGAAEARTDGTFSAKLCSFRNGHDICQRQHVPVTGDICELL